MTEPEPEFRNLPRSGPLLRKFATAIHMDHVARLDQDGFDALHAAFAADVYKNYHRGWTDAASSLRELAAQTTNPIMVQVLKQIIAAFQATADAPPIPGAPGSPHAPVE